MFDRLQQDILQRLKLALENIVSSDCKCLLQIQCSRIGERLATTLTARSHYIAGVPMMSNTPRSFIRFTFAAYGTMIYFANIFIKDCFSDNLQNLLSSLYTRIQDLRNTNSITTHTVEETRRAISYVLPHLESTFVTNFVALAKQQGEIEMRSGST